MAGSQRTWLGEPRRDARQRRIEVLDLERDYLEIAGLTSGDFRSIIFAVPFAGFMTTFAAPRMSRILHGTGEMTQRFAKRAVDTMLFAKAVHTHGFGTPEGRATARKVNQMHARYDIHPDDFVLVGCDPLIFSLDLFDRYGWRPLAEKERQAQRMFYDRQARAFGSRRPLPATEIEMRQLIDHYFDTQLWFEPQNKEMAEIALDWFGGLAPRPLRPLIRKILLAVIDPRVVKACGLPVPSALDRTIAGLAMRTLAARDPVADGGTDGLEALVRDVYPDGQTLAELGPADPSEHKGTRVEAA